MSIECVQLARELANGTPNYRVFLPLLFGQPSQRRCLGIDARGLFCIRNEMHFFAKNATSPLTDLIRQLVTHVTILTGVPSAGVIGMCLTGNMAFALLAQANVAAAVSSQPSLPLVIPFRAFAWLTSKATKAALGIDPADLQESVDGGSPLLVLRFKGDTICPAERIETLSDAFGDGLTSVELPGRKHSVLTADRTAENDQVPILRQFLAANLA